MYGATVQNICTERIFFLKHLIVAGRYRHSGILAFWSIVLVGYRVLTPLIPVPDWFQHQLFSFRYQLWTGCCTLQHLIFVPAFLLSFSPIGRFSSVHCKFNGRLSGQFSGSQAAFGTRHKSQSAIESTTIFLKRVTGRIFTISDFMEAN